MSRITNIHNTSPSHSSHAERLDARQENRRKHLYPLLGGVAVLAVSTALAPAISQAANRSLDSWAHPVAYSSETTQYVAQPNDGLSNAAYSIAGIEQVDLGDVVAHIQNDPANTEVLKDGLQVGESLVVPTHVSPR